MNTIFVMTVNSCHSRKHIFDHNPCRLSTVSAKVGLYSALHSPYYYFFKFFNTQFIACFIHALKPYPETLFVMSNPNRNGACCPSFNSKNTHGCVLDRTHISSSTHLFNTKRKRYDLVFGNVYLVYQRIIFIKNKNHVTGQLIDIKFKKKKIIVC